MKKLCILFVLMLQLQAQAAINVDSTIFPDSNFREYVSKEFDTNSDGVLSDTEIQSVTSINSPTVQSLKGIEYFTELIHLDCSLSYLRELDLTNNLKLKNLDIYHNPINSLKIGNVSMYEFNIGDCAFTKIDVSTITPLDHDYINNIGKQYCAAVKLNGNTFDFASIGFTLSDMLNVTNIACDNNQTGVTISGTIAQFPVFPEIITYTYKITFADGTSRNMDVTLPVVDSESQEEVVTINEDNFPDKVFRTYVMGKFDRDDDGILNREELAGCLRINNIGNVGNIEDIKGIEHLTALRYLDIWCQHISELDLSRNKKLRYLRCDLNYLTELDLSSNTLLEELNCGTCHLFALDLKANTKLKFFDGNLPQVNYEIRVTRTNNTEYPYELDFRNIVPSYSNIVEVQGYKNYTGTELINTVYSDGVVKFAELPVWGKYWYDTGAYINGESQLLSVNLTFELAPLNPEYELWYKSPDDYNIGSEF